MKKEKSLNPLLQLYSYNVTYSSMPLSLCLAIITIFLGFLTIWVPVVVLFIWTVLLILESVGGFQRGVAFGTPITVRKNKLAGLPKEHIVYKKVTYYVYRSSSAFIMNSIKFISAFILISVSFAAIAIK